MIRGGEVFRYGVIAATAVGVLATAGCGGDADPHATSAPSTSITPHPAPTHTPKPPSPLETAVAAFDAGAVALAEDITRQSAVHTKTKDSLCVGTADSIDNIVGLQKRFAWGGVYPTISIKENNGILTFDEASRDPSDSDNPEPESRSNRDLMLIIRLNKAGRLVLADRTAGSPLTSSLVLSALEAGGAAHDLPHVTQITSYRTDHVVNTVVRNDYDDGPTFTINRPGAEGVTIDDSNVALLTGGKGSELSYLQSDLSDLRYTFEHNPTPETIANS